jgi:hypothetical protein
MSRSVYFRSAAWFLIAASGGVLVYSLLADERAAPRRVDPAAWGGDHVGRQFPPYVTGDECLFCHRDIGPTWAKNQHQQTIRLADPDDPALTALREIPDGDGDAGQTRFLMGGQRRTRFLKRSEQYGKLDLLTASFSPIQSKLENGDAVEWDATTFADRCAGCHTTAVNSQTRAFAAVSLDCFTCHGDVPLEHTKDVSLAILSPKNATAREVTSICGQCHLRGGRSRSSGLPYPNTFVSGDNLFRDFQVDLSDGAIAALPPIEQHIFVNARDVAEFEKLTTTCLTCHDMHGQSTAKHQTLEFAAICSSCHDPQTMELLDAIEPMNRQRTHSRVCDY